MSQKSSNILDPIHDSLPPEVWENPQAHEPILKPVHAHFITTHIYEILDQHGYSKPKDWLRLYLTGSLCTYQYGPTSDADISLFVDSSALPEWSRAEMTGLMIEHTERLFLPGTSYQLQCYVVQHGLTPADLYRPHIRAGYDIDHHKWLVPPDHSMAHNPEVLDNGFYTYALEQADKMERLLRYEPDKAVMFWNQIHQRRMRDMKMGKGDYSEANLVYKFLFKRGLTPEIAEVSGQHIAFDLDALLERADNTRAAPTWQPGKPGKGILDQKGRAYAWETNEYGMPFHDTYVQNIPDVTEWHTPVMIAPSGHYTNLWSDEVTGREPELGQISGLRYVPDPSMWQKNMNRGRYGKTGSDIVEFAFQKIVEGGGVTLSVLDGSEPTSGYALPINDEEMQIPLNEFTPKVLDHFISEHGAELLKPGQYLGGWVYNGIVFLDISHVEPNLEAALQKAQATNQLAIYDIDNQRDIPVERDGQVVSSEAPQSWQPGSWGRGLQDAEGNFHAWATTDLGSRGTPHHRDYAQAKGIEHFWNPIIIGPLGYYTHNGTAQNTNENVRQYPLNISGLKYVPDFDKWMNRVSADLTGLPTQVNVPNYGPMESHGNEDLQHIANEYNWTHGLGPHPTNYTPVDPRIGAQIAQAYEQMPHNPNDPEVQAAYQAMANETMAQYDALTRHGYQYEFYPPDHDPYPNSPREAVMDLAKNKHMYVYPTSAGYGMGDDPQEHPLLQHSGLEWAGQPVTYNDLFRAVHDTFGHAKEGVGFRHEGEDNAYRQHAAMFTPLAQRALASETRGQNSWVNFGPYGEQNQTASQGDTVYAPQKAGLLPEWATNPDLHVQRQAGYMTYDPTVCPHCNSPMGEPYMMGHHWMAQCTNCGLTRRVNEESPVFKEWQNPNQTEYPSELQSIWEGKGNPWVFA